MVGFLQDYDTWTVAFVSTKGILSKNGLKRKEYSCYLLLSNLHLLLIFFYTTVPCLSSALVKAFVKSSSTVNLLLYSCPLPFFCSCQVIFCFMINIVINIFCTQSSLSSFLGLLFDLGLSDSTSLRKSFLKISATCCVS